MRGVGFLVFFLFVLTNDVLASNCKKELTAAIPPAWVQKMQTRGQAQSYQGKWLRQAVQNLGFQEIAINQDIVRNHNTYYTVELAQSPITNQKQSGRCWIFAGLNMLRSQLITQQKVPVQFEFSEAYLHFFSMLEKANRYLENVIRYRNTSNEIQLREELQVELGDGGWFEWFLFLVSKYGLVPKEAMPDTKSAENTKFLLGELQEHLASIAVQMLKATERAKAKKLSASEQVRLLRRMKERKLAGIWKILATHLGNPPDEFTFRTNKQKTDEKTKRVTTDVKLETFTPLTFATDFIDFNPMDYVVVSHIPMLATERVYQVKQSSMGPSFPGKRAFNIRFLNLPSERLIELTQSSIDQNQAVWFAADITKSADNKTGILYPGIFQGHILYGLKPGEYNLPLNKAGEMFFSITYPNHAMAIIGYDQPDSSKPIVKFKVENSWGDDRGSKGIYHLYTEWFHDYVFEIVVHKALLSRQERELWSGKAEIVRPEEI